MDLFSNQLYQLKQLKLELSDQYFQEQQEQIKNKYCTKKQREELQIQISELEHELQVKKNGYSTELEGKFLI